MKIKDQKIYFYWTLPFLAIFGVLTIIPALLNFYLSLTSWNLIQPGSQKFAGIRNYLIMASDSRFWNSLKISFYYLIVPVSIQMILGFLWALALRPRLKGTYIIRTLLLIPMVIPPVIVGLTWKVLFTPNLGGINYYLKMVNIKGPDWLNQPFTAQIAVLVAAVWEWTPFVMLLLLAAMENLPSDVMEAATIDGVTKVQMVRYVIFPLIKPVMVIVLLFRIMDALGILPLVFVMTKGGPASATEIINFYAYMSGFVYYKIGYATSLITVLFAIVFALNWYFLNAIVKHQ